MIFIYSTCCHCFALFRCNKKLSVRKCWICRLIVCDRFLVWRSKRQFSARIEKVRPGLGNRRRGFGTLSHSLSCNISKLNNFLATQIKLLSAILNFARCIHTKRQSCHVQHSVSSLSCCCCLGTTRQVFHNPITHHFDISRNRRPRRWIFNQISCTFCWAALLRRLLHKWFN